MAQDERFTAGSAPLREGRDPHGSTGELGDASARLDDGSWDSLEREYAHGGAPANEEPGFVHAFLENQLRERPLPTLLAAVAAGWLVGKLLR